MHVIKTCSAVAAGWLIHQLFTEECVYIVLINNNINRAVQQCCRGQVNMLPDEKMKARGSPLEQLNKKTTGRQADGSVDIFFFFKERLM